MDRLTCKLCKKKRPIKYFGARYHTGKYQGGRPVCIDCDAKIQVGSVYKSPRNYISSRYRDMRQRVKKSGGELNGEIDVDFLMRIYEEQKGMCAVSGLPMTWMHEGLYSNHGSRRGTNISIDRIDSDQGYVPHNIRLVCDRVNKMKSNMTDGDFYFWCAILTKAFNSS